MRPPPVQPPKGRQGVVVAAGSAGARTPPPGARSPDGGERRWCSSLLHKLSNCSAILGSRCRVVEPGQVGVPPHDVGVTQLSNLTDSDVEQLPLDQLGLATLDHFDTSNEWHSGNFINSQQHRSVPARRCLAEALSWLFNMGLLSHGTPDQNTPDATFITRAGAKVLSEGLAPVQAAARLNVGLHPRLAPVRTQFLIGEYELAAFAAMRAVEIYVRELAGESESLLGVKLMQRAFREGGSLADGSLDPGEQVGIMNLFSGAIATFKNPSSHRQVDYSGATEASEVVMLADLLMRVLERSE